MTIKKLDQQSFHSHISSNDVVVVKFGATWCGPCKTIEPMLEKLSQEFIDISFTEIDVEESPGVALEFNVRSLPTIMAWKNGEIQWTKIGVPNLADLKKDLLKILEP